MGENQRLLRWVVRTIKANCISGPLPLSARDALRRAAGELDHPAFFKLLDNTIRAHHSHSRLMSMQHVEGPTSPPSEGRRLQRAPEMRWDAKSRVGFLRFFTYVMDSGAPWDARPPYVERCRAKLEAWLTRMDCRGLVIDLRKHHGGSYRPAMHSLGRHVLSRTVLFRWRSPRGAESVEAYDGEKQTTTRVLPRYVHAAHANAHSCPVPIAVLIGPGTASSGEIVAAMLAGKEGVRTFGAQTAGALSVNEGFPFDARVQLLLTVRQVRTTDDALHTTETLAPDEATNAPEQRAVKWIVSQYS